MRPKLQKRSALKFVGRIIPRAKLSGTIYDKQPLALGFIPVIYRKKRKKSLIIKGVLPLREGLNQMSINKRF
jgi:hypothetical protein